MKVEPLIENACTKNFHHCFMYTNLVCVKWLFLRQTRNYEQSVQIFKYHSCTPISNVKGKLWKRLYSQSLSNFHTDLSLRYIQRVFPAIKQVMKNTLWYEKRRIFRITVHKIAVEIYFERIYDKIFVCIQLTTLLNEKT